MISTLQAFLITAASEQQEQEIDVAARFPQKFRVRALSMGEWERIQKLSTDPDKPGRTDGLAMLRRVAIAGCVDPEFKSEEFLKQLGAATSDEALTKTLKAGEVVKIANAVLKFSGFGESVEEARKQAQD
jgi:hypothetical protein